MTEPSLTFLGGVGTVTGSKHLVSTGSTQVLLDCGLFQGLSTLRRRNWTAPPFDLDRLDAVVLTHAHLDHCGYLPVLARHGWRGPVFATEGTARLAEIVLSDSAHLQEEEAHQANAGGWSKHRPALPLYDAQDAARACALLRPIGHGESVSIARDVTLMLGRAGHILGSSWAWLSTQATRGPRFLVYSGDLGRPGHALLRPPEPRPAADAVLLESTYGDRTRQDADALDTLAAAIRRTAGRGGSVLIPAFAVDRTEVLLVALHELRVAGAIPEMPIVVDSPMALACLTVYRRAQAAHWPEMRPDLPADALDSAGLTLARTAEESESWNEPSRPAIVISASGMASGGRVLHHLRHMLPDPRHTVAIVGFAAEGTRARQMLDGATVVKIHGRYVPVRAEILALDSFSAHADRGELLHWATTGPPPGACYLVHGEPASSAALAGRLREEAGWNAVVPREGERVLL